MPVAAGQKAPEFSLYDTDKNVRHLKDFAGKKTVLVFYPGAFTGVCTKEMCAFRDSLGQFSDLSAQVVGISVDSPFANKAFAAQNNLSFPLLSDPERHVVKSYGIELKDFAGLKGYATAQRSVFVLDPQGSVKYAWVAENPGIEPNYDEVRKAVASF